MARHDRCRRCQTKTIPRYRRRALQRVSDGSAILIAESRFALWTALLVGCAATRLAHADAAKLQGEIATAETVIVVAAGEHAPRLVTLTLRGAPAWKNARDETLPAQVRIHGSALAVNWRVDRGASRFESKDIQIVYVADSPPLKAVWRWRARAEHGPIEHSVSIQNLGDEPVWLQLQPSLSFEWEVDPKSALERFWVEKGADIPSPHGMHLDALLDGDTWQGTSSTYAIPAPNRAREMIPYVLVDEPAADRRGWYMGIEFSGRTRITLQRAGASLRGEAGLDPMPGPYETSVAPGGTFETPTIFVG